MSVRRVRIGFGAAAALALLLATGGAASGAGGGPGSVSPAALADLDPVPAVSPSPEPEVPEPDLLAAGLGSAATEAPEPTAPPTTAPPQPPAPPAPAPSRQPPAEPEPLPPPAPPRYEGECIAEYVGEAAAMAEVAAVLTDAAGRTYWPISAPEIRVPLNLVKATAWQESGWQSNIIACDGGVGVMQVMPDTAAFVNQRFAVSYDIHTLSGNAVLGANYLAWLIKFFGDLYFGGSYVVDAGHCADHLSPCLLNAVVAAYNFGPGAVDVGGQIVIPNPRYVENVRALMTSCVCLSY